MISNTWAQFYNVVESAEEKNRVCTQDGMVGEECQERSAKAEHKLE